MRALVRAPGHGLRLMLQMRIEAHVPEDLLDHRPLEDRGDDLELSTAAVTQRQRGVLRCGSSLPPFADDATWPPMTARRTAAADR
jgi:hypothetical protein